MSKDIEERLRKLGLTTEYIRVILSSNIDIKNIMELSNKDLKKITSIIMSNEEITGQGWSNKSPFYKIDGYGVNKQARGETDTQEPPYSTSIY